MNAQQIHFRIDPNLEPLIEASRVYQKHRGIGAGKAVDKTKRALGFVFVGEEKDKFIRDEHKRLRDEMITKQEARRL